MLARLGDILERARFNLQMLEYAVVNARALETKQEDEALAFFSGYPRVAAVWLDGDLLMVRIIKGAADGIVRTNAIPVADESEARRWAILLNASAPDIESFPTERTLRLVARDGIAFPETST